MKQNGFTNLTSVTSNSILAPLFHFVLFSKAFHNEYKIKFVNE